MSTLDGGSGKAAFPTRRRRSFLAAGRSESLEADTIPAALEKIAEEDDIPLLTEVVPPDQNENPAAPADEPVPVPVPVPDLSAGFDVRLEELVAQMAEAIGRQMAYELPTLIEATLLNASEELRTGITATMEAALRDFSARRKQLQLPLDPPGAESGTPR